MNYTLYVDDWLKYANKLVYPFKKTHLGKKKYIYIPTTVSSLNNFNSETNTKQSGSVTD